MAAGESRVLGVHRALAGGAPLDPETLWSATYHPQADFGLRERVQEILAADRAQSPDAWALGAAASTAQMRCHQALVSAANSRGTAAASRAGTLYGWESGVYPPRWLSPSDDRTWANLSGYVLRNSGGLGVLAARQLLGDVLLHRAADLGVSYDAAWAAVSCKLQAAVHPTATGEDLKAVIATADEWLCAGGAGGPGELAALREARRHQRSRRAELRRELLQLRAETAAAERRSGEHAEAAAQLAAQLAAAAADGRAAAQRSEAALAAAEAEREQLQRERDALLGQLSEAGRRRAALSEGERGLDAAAAGLRSRRAALLRALEPPLQGPRALSAEAIRARDDAFAAAAAEARAAAESAHALRAEALGLAAAAGRAELERDEGARRRSLSAEESAAAQGLCAAACRELQQLEQRWRGGAEEREAELRSAAQRGQLARAALQRTREAGAAARAAAEETERRRLYHPPCAGCSVGAAPLPATRMVLSTGQLALCDVCAADPLRVALCPVTGVPTTGEVAVVRDLRAAGAAPSESPAGAQ